VIEVAIEELIKPQMDASYCTTLPAPELLQSAVGHRTTQSVKGVFTPWYTETTNKIPWPFKDRRATTTK
jgi:hypothetical protein